MKKKPFIIILWGCLFAVTLYFQVNLIDSRYSVYKPLEECPWCEEGGTDEVVYIPLDTFVIRGFFPADSHFLADLLWLRVVYYFGQHVLTDRQYPYLFHLLDMITDLSPLWTDPYIFGAVILPSEAGLTEEGLYLIEKGLIYNEGNWNLHFFKGYYLWKSGDAIAAAESFHKASLCDGAPIYLANFSATLASRSGQKELALFFLQESLRNIKTQAYREMLLKKINELMESDTDDASTE